MNDLCPFCNQLAPLVLGGEPVTGLRIGDGVDDWVIVHVSCLNAERDKDRQESNG